MSYSSLKCLIGLHAWSSYSWVTYGLFADEPDGPRTLHYLDLERTCYLDLERTCARCDKKQLRIDPALKASMVNSK